MRRITAYFILYWMSTNVLSKDITLNTTSNVKVKCKESIVLQCNISLPEPVKVLRMEWDGVCNNIISITDCDYKKDKSLTLTIHNATEENTKLYTCTVEAKEGHGMAHSNVTVEGCDDPENKCPCGQDGQFNISSALWTLMLLSLILSYSIIEICVKVVC